MAFIWRKFTSMGQHNSTLKKVEDDEKLQICSSSLHCPICFLIFPSEPRILPCGHTFCKKCLDRSQRIGGAQSTHHECALCRKRFPKAFGTRNFVVEDILSHLDGYKPPDVPYESDIISTQKVTIQRLREKIKSLESDNRVIAVRLEKSKSLLNVIAVVCTICVFSLLYKLYVDFSS